MLFFEPTVLNSEHCTARFTAKDGDASLGVCELLLHDRLADITAISLQTEDLSIGEGLLRAALNFAANRGYYMAVFSAKDAEAVQRRLPFEQKNGRLQGDIPSLLAGTCGNVDKS